MAEIEIVYCKPCGYVARAQAVASALQAQLGLSATLVPGKGGVFEVRADGQTVIKRTRTAFPTPQQIVAALQARS